MVESAVVDPNGLETGRYRGEDDLRLLRSIPTESVDLAYLDPPVFSGWIHEGSWADGVKASSSEDRWHGGVRAYMDWIAAPLEDLHRVLKPTGALFLVCDEAVGIYVRLLLDELFSQRDAHNQMVWWKANSGPEHHYVFYYRRSGNLGRSNHYTIIHREGNDGGSLVAFSFLQGRRKRCISPELAA